MIHVSVAAIQNGRNTKHPYYGGIDLGTSELSQKFLLKLLTRGESTISGPHGCISIQQTLFVTKYFIIKERTEIPQLLYVFMSVFY